MIEYETSASSLKRLVEQDNSDRFRIIVNVVKRVFMLNNSLYAFEQNKKQELLQTTIQTTINKARVISRKINELYQIDPTINEYCISLPNKDEYCKAIKNNQVDEILKLIIKSTSEKISIPQDQQNIFSLIQYLLGESNQQADKDLKYQINSQEEAISFLCTEFHTESIEYLSGHFIELIESDQMKNISEEILYEIIDKYLENNNDKSKEEIEKIYDILENENESNFLIHLLISIDPSQINAAMIEYIYNNLNDDIVQKDLPRIIQFIKSHFTEYIQNSKKDVKKREEKAGKIHCDFNGDELNGIIQYLRTNFGDDLENRKILKLSGGGKKNPAYPLTNLIKYDQNSIGSYYYNYCNLAPSENEGWIEFDFIDRKVRLSSYTIRTKSNYYPKSWRIVGSNDQKKWDVINIQSNNSALNGSQKQHRFDVKNDSNYYRYIRYIQEDNWHNYPQCKYYIYLTCIEFFGDIRSPNESR